MNAFSKMYIWFIVTLFSTLALQQFTASVTFWQEHNLIWVIFFAAVSGNVGLMTPLVTNQPTN
jgi:hypothetical protein